MYSSIRAFSDLLNKPVISGSLPNSFEDRIKKLDQRMDDFQYMLDTIRDEYREFLEQTYAALQNNQPAKIQKILVDFAVHLQVVNQFLPQRARELEAERAYSAAVYNRLPDADRIIAPYEIVDKVGEKFGFSDLAKEANSIKSEEDANTWVNNLFEKLKEIVLEAAEKKARHKLSLREHVKAMRILDILFKYTIYSITLNVQPEQLKLYESYFQEVSKTITNILKKEPGLNFGEIPSEVSLRFMLQNDQYTDEDILFYCRQKKKSNAKEKEKILNIFAENDLRELILWYRVCLDWEMPAKGIKALLGTIKHKYPEYADLDLAVAYLVKPESAAFADLPKIYALLQLPYMDLLTQRKADFLQTKAAEIAELAKSGKKTFAEILIPENSEETDPSSKENSLDESYFETRILPNIDEREGYTIDVAKLNNKTAITRFIESIKLKFDVKRGDKGTLVIDHDTLLIDLHFLGYKTIKTRMDLRTMELTILNLDALELSSREAQILIENRLTSILYKTARANRSSQTTAYRDFLQTGNSRRVRELAWREYQKDLIRNVKFSDEYNQPNGRNPFDAQYHLRTLLPDRVDKIYCLEPLFGLTEAQAKARKKNGEDIVVLGHRKFTIYMLTKGEPREEAIDLCIANQLVSANQSAEDRDVQNYKLGIMTREIDDKYIVRDETDEYKLRFRANGWEVKSEAGDTLFAEQRPAVYNYRRPSIEFYEVIPD